MKRYNDLIIDSILLLIREHPYWFTLSCVSIIPPLIAWLISSNIWIAGFTMGISMLLYGAICGMLNDDGDDYY